MYITKNCDPNINHCPYQVGPTPVFLKLNCSYFMFMFVNKSIFTFCETKTPKIFKTNRAEKITH